MFASQAVQSDGAAVQLAVALLTALLHGPDRTSLVAGKGAQAGSDPEQLSIGG